jgi:hypothetical protein
LRLAIDFQGTEQIIHAENTYWRLVDWRSYLFTISSVFALIEDVSIFS